MKQIIIEEIEEKKKLKKYKIKKITTKKNEEQSR